MANTTNLSIDFDFSHYLPTENDLQDSDTTTDSGLDSDQSAEQEENNNPQPQKLIARPINKIVELNTEQTRCKKIVVSVIADGLELGRQYTITYSLSNLEEEIFTPRSETFYASKVQQKFSTIANIQENKIYIMKVDINRTGSGISASDMITVKCGLLTTCDIEPKPLSLSEYVKFENRPIYEILPPYRCDSRVSISARINNAKKGAKYTYTFSSLESDSSNQISFYPQSGIVIAGSEVQNFDTSAKFMGKNNFFCIKADVVDTSDQHFEDFLIIQCKTCN